MTLLSWTLLAHLFVAAQAEPSGSDPIVEPASTSAAPPKVVLKEEPQIAEEMLKLRDPFRAPEILSLKAQLPKTDLERYPLDEYKLLGVITGPNRLRALLLCPNGKTYFVGEKTKIGMHRGIIRRITPDRIDVREKITNALGQEENLDGEIRLSAGNASSPTESTEVGP